MTSKGSLQLSERRFSPFKFHPLKAIRLAPSFAIATPVQASLLTALLLGTGGMMPLVAMANHLPLETIAQMPVGSSVIYVNPATGNDSPSSGSSAAAAYRTITYALQQASAGTVIQLAPGSYTAQTGEVFPLIVKSGVTLRGDEGTKGATIGIIGGGSYISPTFAGQNVTLRAEKDSQVSGVGITNPNTRGTGLWIESTNAVVRNNTFSKSKREGVFVSGTANPLIEGNIFTQNDGNGLSVARQSTGQVRGNVFNNTGTGIAVTETASPLIVGNQIVSNRDGIVVANDAAPVLRENIIQSNRDNGVVAIANAKPDLGTGDSPGKNLIRNNNTANKGSYDVANLNTNYTLSAVGNDIDSKKIFGKVNFTATSVGGKFADIQGHWAQSYIEALVSRDIIAGFPDGTFRPNDPVTRVQFAAIINKAIAPAAIRAATNFSDVSTSFWGYSAIQTAYRGEFVSGYPDKTFRPNQRIPRVEVLVALASGLKLRSDNTSVLSVFTDAAQIPNWASTAVAGATIKELVVNYPNLNQLNPNRDATRAEVAAFVYQALVSGARVPAINSPYIVRSPQ